MASTATEAELVELEKRFWGALKDRNTDEAIRLSDFPVLLTGPQGVGSIDEETFGAMMKDARYTIDRADLSEVKVRLLRDDVALVAYKVHEELTVEGKPVTIDAADTSTWIRRDGRWACAMHTEAIAGDPFGRDRRP